MRLLIVNVGSSTVKIRILDGDRIDMSETIAIEPGRPGRLVERLGHELGSIDGVVHRVVHGGTEFTDPVLVDDDVLSRLRSLGPLAPLHQAQALDVLSEMRAASPALPHVACFDTAFHATLPDEATTWALPAAWRNLGVRRFGFHGLSHAHVSRRAPAIAGGRGSGLRIVSCHLGSGASIAAIRDGRSIDTTMGMTPLDGLVMATRSGGVDPGVLLWLQKEKGLTLDALSDGLSFGGGLLGVTGTADLEEVLVRADEGDGEARLATAIYLRSLRANIAAMAAALGGVDILAFTGGVGEHAPTIRSAAVASVAFLGIELDEAANARATGDALISTSSSAAASVVVESREDLEMARLSQPVLASFAD